MKKSPFGVYTGGNEPYGYVEHDKNAAVRAASAEASAREMAMYATPRPQIPERPELKKPILPADLADRVRQMNDAIFQRGISIDRTKLVTTGKARFQELIELDRKNRAAAFGGGADYTDFASVQNALGAHEATGVPPRKTREQYANEGLEREAVRPIREFGDLWKFSGCRKEITDNVFAFIDAYETLLMGTSMVERLGSDGKIRSRFLCNGRSAETFRRWGNVIVDPIVRVEFVEPLFSITAFLAHEKGPAPDIEELASWLLGVRVPNETQMATARAILHAFLYGYRNEWDLWSEVGRDTRTSHDRGRLENWRKQLAARFPAIAGWHDEVRRSFLQSRGYGVDHHMQIDLRGHRRFVNATLNGFRRRASEILALALEGPEAGILARFDNEIWISGKIPENPSRLHGKLAEAFPGARFELRFSERTK